MLRVGQPPVIREVGLFELHERLVVRTADPDEATVVLADGVAREADDSLHERASLAALECGLARRVEDDDVTARRRAEVGEVREGKQAVVEVPKQTGEGR